jgi:hypothetical protein
MSDNERSTKVVKLSEDSWADLGRGPAMVAAYGAEMVFRSGEDTPAANDVGMLLRFDASPLSVPTRGRLWAKACFAARNTRAVVLPLDDMGVLPVCAGDFK